DPREYILDRSECLLALDLQVRPRSFVRFLTVDLLESSPRAERVERFINRNPVKPAVELETRVIVRQMLESFQERRLGHVHGILGIAQHAQRRIEDRLLIPPYQLLEGISLPLPTSAHERRVILLFHKYRSARKRLEGPADLATGRSG